MTVDRKKASAQKGSIRKRTPLEQAIAEQTDKRARYDARLRQQGFKRTTIWVREDRLDQLKELVKSLNESAPEGQCQ